MKVSLEAQLWPSAVSQLDPTPPRSWSLTGCVASYGS